MKRAEKLKNLRYIQEDHKRELEVANERIIAKQKVARVIIANHEKSYQVRVAEQFKRSQETAQKLKQKIDEDKIRRLKEREESEKRRQQEVLSHLRKVEEMNERRTLAMAQVTSAKQKVAVDRYLRAIQEKRELAKYANRRNEAVSQRCSQIEQERNESKIKSHIESVRKFHEKLVLREEILNYNQEVVKIENEKRHQRHL